MRSADMESGSFETWTWKKQRRKAFEGGGCWVEGVLFVSCNIET